MTTQQEQDEMFMIVIDPVALDRVLQELLPTEADRPSPRHTASHEDIQARLRRFLELFVDGKPLAVRELGKLWQMWATWVGPADPNLVVNHYWMDFTPKSRSGSVELHGEAIGHFVPLVAA